MQPISHFDKPLGNAYGFRELTLADMLRDPIVQDIMRSDGVSPSDVRKIFSRWTERRLTLGKPKASDTRVFENNGHEFMFDSLMDVPFERVDSRRPRH